MNSLPSRWLIPALLLLTPLVRPTSAQTPSDAVLPEVDAYIRLDSNLRLYLQAKEYIEDGDLTHAQLGPSLQLNLRPWEKLKKITIFDLDDMKCMPVEFVIGYRYLPSSDHPPTNRIQPIVRFHVPMPGSVLLSDMNRWDLDWSSGSFTWQYHNRITAERRVTIHSYHPGPYASAEFVFQSQYQKWSSTRLYAGCLLPLGKHVQLDPYYEHVNNTGKQPNYQVNVAGLILSLYFAPAQN
jgi:hypothetical protein